jgi:hypothetical protein
MDSGSVTFYKNGLTQGSAFTGLTGTLFPTIGNTNDAAAGTTVNFGQSRSPTSTATVLPYRSSAGGYFLYAPPTGFKALSTDNLAIPSIIKPKNYFDAKTYTGTGGSQSITGLDFTPSLVWIKNRTDVASHAIFDSVRGVQTFLSSNSTAAEDTDDTQSLSSFNSNGFSLGTGASTANVNTSGKDYISWNWKESATAGFDIVTYTGTGANTTVAHNLGRAPDFYMIKRRDAGVREWTGWHTGIGDGTKYIGWSTTAAVGTDATAWNSTKPTASVFSLGTFDGVNASGGTYVAYLFASTTGFSTFGSYTGNGSADGPFVYTGFKPKFVMIKNSDGTDGSNADWVVYDSARSTYNPLSLRIYPNLSQGDGSSSSYDLDLLSNGFKPRANIAGTNTSGAVYIYAAFAEVPFKYTASDQTVSTSGRIIRLAGHTRLMGVRLW